MPPVKKGDAKRVALPPITVGKFEQVGYLIERMVRENTEAFVGAGQEYRDQHRAGASRPLTAVEAVQVAAAALDDRSIEDRALAFQQSELRAYDEPRPVEVLVAAGVATAPAALRATVNVVALLEMPADEFEAALESGCLDEAVAERAVSLKRLELAEGRARASRALEHFAAAAGQEPGKAVGLLARTVLQALQQAIGHLTQSFPSESESLVFSPVSLDGLDETSFTGSPGATPSNS